MAAQRTSKEIATPREWVRNLNLCVECCDRHVTSGRIALYWEGTDRVSAVFTFAKLQEEATRFANFLRTQGIQRGDSVACLLPPIPELLVTMLGIWRAGAVYVPLATELDSQTVNARLKQSQTRLIVTDSDHRRLFSHDEEHLSVMTVARRRGQATLPGDLSFRYEVERQPADFQPVIRTENDAFLFSSAADGEQVSVAPLPLKALRATIAYLQKEIDLRPEDIYWNMADLGEAEGLLNAVVGPLLLGQAVYLYDGDLTAKRILHILDKYSITHWVAPPDVLRTLMKASDVVRRQTKPLLRRISSTGVGFDPELIQWVKAHWDCTIDDV